MNISFKDSLDQVVEGMVSQICDLDQKWFREAAESSLDDISIDPEVQALLRLLDQANEYFSLDRDYRQNINLALVVKMRALGNRMQYPTPRVWLAYKYLAYQMKTDPIIAALNDGVVSQILTWGDLVRHCSVDGYVCGKRLHFLHLKIDELKGNPRNKELEQMFMVSQDYGGATMSRYPQLVGDGLFPESGRLNAVLVSSQILDVSMDSETLRVWSEHEPVKWTRYI